jgi:serine/threonine-protein kinase
MAIEQRVTPRNSPALPSRYRVRRRIATGGMASVWCAYDAILSRDVAIKVLAEQFAHDEYGVRRFKREARMAARLSGHAHVVTIYDVGELDVDATVGGRPFIVMEYLAGGTVADALRAGEVTLQDALRWIWEAALALDFAHGRGIVHRDIKPANFLLDRDRTLHAADFGIARIGNEDPITRTGDLFGTAAYLSPEQALGRPATEASDRYALAVTAFELLVGERPFTAEGFAAQARQHIDQPPPRASGGIRDLPRSLDEVLARGLAKRPEQRWGSAREFAVAIERAVLSTAKAPARAPRLRRTRVAPIAPVGQRPIASRSPRVAALAALAAAALGVGIAAGASSGGNPLPVKARSQARSPAQTPPQPPKQAGQSPRPKRQLNYASGVPAAATTPSPTADTLEAQGHQLMAAGNYAAAIPILRRAVGDATPQSLTYAYALFDLGRSLRLAGDPRAAAVILQERLAIPNQTGVVRHELELALQAIGAQVNVTRPPKGSGDGSGPPGKGHGDHGQGHGNGGGNDGGD